MLRWYRRGESRSAGHGLRGSCRQPAASNMQQAEAAMQHGAIQHERLWGLAWRAAPQAAEVTGPSDIDHPVCSTELAATPITDT